jgi:hypothetical protein
VVVPLNEGPKAELRKERLLRFKRNPWPCCFPRSDFTGRSATCSPPSKSARSTTPAGLPNTLGQSHSTSPQGISSPFLWFQSSGFHFSAWAFTSIFSRKYLIKSGFAKGCCRMRKMEQPSRRLIIVSTVLTGLFIVVGFMTAFYAPNTRRTSTFRSTRAGSS